MKSKIDAIYDGWKNIIWKDEKIELEAKRRAAICSKCREYRNILFPYCHACGCPIATKVRSMSKNNKCYLSQW